VTFAANSKLPNLQEMKSWLMSLVKTIDENPLEEQEKQLTALFFIILCLGKAFLIYKYLSNSDVLLLTKMITLKPEPEKRSCSGYDFLKSCLLDERYVHVYVYRQNYSDYRIYIYPIVSGYIQYIILCSYTTGQVLIAIEILVNANCEFSNAYNPKQLKCLV
jgi:hypothetical protein